MNRYVQYCRSAGCILLAGAVCQPVGAGSATLSSIDFFLYTRLHSTRPVILILKVRIDWKTDKEDEIYQYVDAREYPDGPEEAQICICEISPKYRSDVRYRNPIVDVPGNNFPALFHVWVQVIHHCGSHHQPRHPLPCFVHCNWHRRHNNTQLGPSIAKQESVSRPT